MNVTQPIHAIFNSSIMRWANKYRLNIFLIFLVITWGIFGNSMFSGELLVWTIVFLSGFVWAYFFNKIYDREEDKISQPDEVLQDSELLVFRYICWTLFLLPIVILLVLQLPLWPYLAPVAFGFLYSYPFLRGKRLKNFFIVKNLIAVSAFVWPYAYMTHVANPQMSWEQLLVTFIPLFCLIWCIELMWDIRDKDGDAAAGVKTIPAIWGVLPTKIIIIALVLGSVFVGGTALLSIVLVAIWTFIMTILATPGRPRWFYHLFLYIDIILILLFSH